MALVWDGPFRDVDPLTLGAIVQVQLEDGEEMASSRKDKQREGNISDAQMALEMYMEDLRSSHETLKDRTMAASIAMAVLSDEALIHEAYRQEQQFARDREFAQRLFNGNDNDNAPRAGPSGSSAKAQKTAGPDPWQDAELLAKAAAIYMPLPIEIISAPLQDKHAEASDQETVAESSVWAATRKTLEPSNKRTCTACGDKKDFYEVARVPCNHEYCRECLENLFTLSMKDETLFPPRCDGQEIPLSTVRFFLPSRVAKEFESKYEELSTKNRTYCHDRTCSTFIPLAGSDEYGTCPRCQKTTCSTCKSPAHSGDCPADTSLQLLLETADTEQWQRCRECSRFVELSIGCNHITCPCGAEFCYVCGTTWYQCGCPQWDEHNLVARAEQIVDRHPRRRLYQPQRVAHAQPTTRPASPSSTAATVAGPASRPSRVLEAVYDSDQSEWEDDFSDHEEWQVDWWRNAAEANVAAITPPIEDPPNEEVPAEPPQMQVPWLLRKLNERDDRIAEAMDRLRANHECGHDKWRYVRGRHACEECHHVLREYIFECKQCELQACNRCRRNRL